METTSNSDGWAIRPTRAWVFAAALLAGCAPMAESECRSADWYALGVRDGLAGLRPFVDQYAYQCSVAKVEVADSTYLSGWQHGKWQYDSRVQQDGASPP